MRTLSLPLSFFVAMALHLPLHAQSMESVCKPLLDNGVFDQHSLATDSSQFRLVRSIVCSDEFEAYSSARSSSASLGIDVIEVVDATLGGSTDSSSYSSRRSSYCSLDTSDAYADERIRLATRRSNDTLASLFVSCVKALQGAYSYVEPSSDLSVFTVHVQKKNLQGSNRLEIVEFVSAPAVEGCSGGLTESTPENPVIVNGSASFLCRRSSSEEPISLAGNTRDDGPLFRRAIELPGTVATIASLALRVRAIESAVPPKGTLALFNLDRCPKGWLDVPRSWEGRYFVSTVDDQEPGSEVGVQLEDGENRATGRHVHLSANAFRGGTCNREDGCAKWGEDNEIARSRTETGVSEIHRDDVNISTQVPGTPAPYVTLRACLRE